MDEKRDWLKVAHFVKAHADSELPDSEWIYESASSVLKVES